LRKPDRDPFRPWNFDEKSDTTVSIQAKIKRGEAARFHVKPRENVKTLDGRYRVGS
jgi:hypothetical protein